MNPIERTNLESEFRRLQTEATERQENRLSALEEWRENHMIDYAVLKAKFTMIASIISVLGGIIGAVIQKYLIAH